MSTQSVVLFFVCNSLQAMRSSGEQSPGKRKRNRRQRLDTQRRSRFLAEETFVVVEEVVEVVVARVVAALLLAVVAVLPEAVPTGIP